MITVTKTFLPAFDEYSAILKRAWDKAWITNNGELVQELEMELKLFNNVRNLFFCSNGTIALQIALRSLGITKEVITTPFSYVATLNAILWEGCTPVFVDIDPKTFCIDVNRIESSITERTEAVLATHVYGYPCDVNSIQEIADKHRLKVIYDGAHAFGCFLNSKSLLSFGDISTCSFHATKIFHTVEGGCIIAKDDDVANNILLCRSFGHIGDDYYSIGINGKNSEFHAAMGLAILPKFAHILDERKKIFLAYQSFLPDSLIQRPQVFGDFQYNYSYFPIVVQNQNLLLKIISKLALQNIQVRRYFFPSLNLLPQVGNIKSRCPSSEDISTRVICLPLYLGLGEREIEIISSVIKEEIE